MSRSYDQRRFPSGPQIGPGGGSALRGPKRIGPIRGIVPGDDVEVAREIARLWQAIRSPVTSGEDKRGCCPRLGDGPMRWVGRNYLQTYMQHSSLLGFWRLGDESANGKASGGMLFRDASPRVKDLSVMVPYAGDDHFSINGPAPKLGTADDGAVAFSGQGPSRALGVSDASFGFENLTPFTITCWFAGGRDASYNDGDPLDTAGAERVLFGVRADSNGSSFTGNAFHWNGQSKILYFVRRSATGAETRIMVPYTFALDPVDAGFWNKWSWGVVAAPELMAAWHHAAATFDGSTLKVYLDGVLIASKASAISMGVAPPTSVRLGWGVHGVAETVRMFPGAVDEAAIFDSALTAAQIREIYRAGGDPSATGSWQQWEVGPADLSAEFWESARVPRRRVFEDLLTVTSSKTLQAPLSISFVLCDATTGALTVTLPPVAEADGARLLLKKVDASANAVTVDADGAETIDGAATFVLSAQYETLLIFCDGATWRVQGKSSSGGSGIPASLLDLKGDLIVASADNTAGREPVGANDTVLTADSVQPRGVRWTKVGNAQVADAAAIAYSKLNLASAIVNADIAAGAAIAKSKLAALGIVDADVGAAAAISASKLAVVGVRAKRTATQSIPNTVDTAIQFSAADDFDTDAFHDPVTNNTRLTVPAGKGGKYLISYAFRWASNATGLRAGIVKKNGVDRLVADIFPATSGEVIDGGTTLVELVAGDYVELYAYQSSGGPLNIDMAADACHLEMALLGT